MAKKAWFEDWFDSDYYHQLYFERDEDEAKRFIEKILNHLKPPPGAKMLDVASGKGRHAVQLANAGFDVTGIDLSEASVAEAKAYEHDRLHFFLHDMRLPFYINYFDYAFNFFTSFGYFETQREHDNAIRTIAQSLKPGGILVIDYLNVHYAEDHLVHVSDVQMGEVNFHITKWFDESHFYKKIIVEDERLEDIIEQQEKVAKFSLGDFTDMLAYQGMQVQEVFGDYQLNDYHVKNSPRMIIIASRMDVKK